MKRTNLCKSVKLTVALFSAYLTAIASALASPLFNGGASDWKVINQDGNDPVLTYAAQEFVTAVGKISGVTLPRETGTEPVENSVFIGVDSSLPQNGNEYCVNKYENGVLMLTGNEPRAALHAVYAFLQMRLGVRWFGPGDDGEFMPSLSSYEIPAGLDWHHVPAIKYRGFHNCGDWYKRAEFIVWMARNFATIHRHGVSSADRKYGFYNMYSTHNANLSGNTQLFNEHPECYALINGTRIKSNICFSSELAVTNVVAALRSTLNSTYREPLDILSIFPADNQDYCKCPECASKSVSTAWFSFYNKCVAALKPDYPNVKFATIAYQGYRGVPECPVPDTEFVEYATHGRCNMHPFHSPSTFCPNSAADYATMLSWNSKGVPMGQYAYEYDTFSSNPAFYPIWSQIDETVDVAVANHHVVLIPEASLSPRNGPDVKASSIRDRSTEMFYLQKMWDSSITFESWMDDTLPNVFGAAAPSIRDYYLTMNCAWTNSTKHFAILGNGLSLVSYVLKPDVVEAATTSLNAAKAAADIAPVEREQVLFDQWKTLLEKYEGVHVTIQAPRMADAGPIDGEIAKSFAFAETNGTASAISVRAAWKGTTGLRGGKAETLVVEFLDVPQANLTGDAELGVKIVSLYGGSYEFAVGESLVKSASHVSSLGIPESYDPEWTAESSGSVIRFYIPVSTFETVPSAGETWSARFYFKPSSGETAAFPSFAEDVIDLRFMDRDADGRKLLYYYGRPDYLGDTAIMKQQAAEAGFDMSLATNANEVAAAMPSGTRVFYLRLASLNQFSNADHAYITNVVANGGVVLLTSYWNMTLPAFFGDSSFACSVGTPKMDALATRRATYGLECDITTVPNNIYTKQMSSITPAYVQLPADESAWTVLFRSERRNPDIYSYGADYPYLMYRKFGKGIVAVGSETLSWDYYSFLENMIALQAKDAQVSVDTEDDLWERICAARAAWVESGEPQLLKLSPGSHLIYRDLYIDFPLTLKGETGNPADVSIHGAGNHSIMTINHADAVVEDLTVENGFSNLASTHNLYNWGVAAVRIAAPNNTDPDTAQYYNTVKGRGGTLRNCIVKGNRTSYFHNFGIVYVNGPKDKSLVENCVITENTSSHQTNTMKGYGDMLCVVCGVARGTLVYNNVISATYGYEKKVLSSRHGMVGCNGSDAVISNCTVVANRITGVGNQFTAGIYASAGKVVDSIVSGNTIAGWNDEYIVYPAELKAQEPVWTGNSNCFVNCLMDTAGPVNATCVSATYTLSGFLDAANGDFGLTSESPARGIASAGRDAGYRQFDGTAAKSVYFVSSLNGDGNEPQPISVTAFTTGLTAPVTYTFALVDENGHTNSVSQGGNAFETTLSKGLYSLIVSAEDGNGEKVSVCETDYYNILIGSGTRLIASGSDFQKQFDDWCAVDGFTALPQEFVLEPGTYTITNELMLTWPCTIRSSTGNPADVIIDAEDRNKIACLNNAQAKLSGITFVHGLCNGVNSYGIIRICNPRGRGNQTNSDMNGTAYGGTVSNCVVTASRCTDKLAGGVLYMNAAAGLITHCVVTNCSMSGQTDGLSCEKGTALFMKNGTCRNSLFAKNTCSVYGVASLSAGQIANVSVTGGKLINCTVADNAKTGDTRGGVGGLRRSGGQVVNCLIAGNTSNTVGDGDFSNYSGASSALIASLVETDLESFLLPTKGDFRIVEQSGAFGAGTNGVEWVYGDTDLAGIARARDGIIDIGAYQFDINANVLNAEIQLPQYLYDSVPVSFLTGAGGFGLNPVFYWDFDGDGKADYETPEKNFTYDFPLGTYDVTVYASNLVAGVGASYHIENSAFTVGPHPVHFVDVNCETPVSPYLTPDTAATNIQDAVDVAYRFDEVIVKPGTYETDYCIMFTNADVIVRGESGKPEDVLVIPAAGSKNHRLLTINAGAASSVSSMTFANGRGHRGVYGKSGQALGVCVEIAGTTDASNGYDQLSATQLGGMLSNCVVRGGYYTGKFCASSGVYAHGANAYVTHCVISNNTNGGHYTDNGWPGASALYLRAGAKADNCLIVGNKGYVNSGGFMMATVRVGGSGSKLSYSTIVDNVARLVGGVDLDNGGSFEKCVIAGNTIYGTDTTNPRHKVWGAFNFNLTTTKRNTQLAEYLETERANATNETYYGNATYSAVDGEEDVVAMGEGTVYTTKEALVRDSANGDYTLPRNSPAKDRVPAVDESLPRRLTDLLGNPRLAYGAYDFGCFEYPLYPFRLIVK